MRVNRHEYGEDSQVVGLHNGTGKLLKIFLGKLSLNDLELECALYDEVGHIFRNGYMGVSPDFPVSQKLEHTQRSQ